ncbi:hypothetical protein LCGC14_0617680 [marine sediment metagenome]|uniref:Uncharacterized protein n=1 Tax=marine sediment metagenome TaxID=412755 RepID=A0A0F9TS44_9ZZZZ
MNYVEPKPRLCKLCSSTHCFEVNADGEPGCCFCYNIRMVNENGTTISLCEGCKKE